MMYGRRAADGAFDGVCPPPGKEGREGRRDEWNKKEEKRKRGVCVE
jgi:hypothetical protein